MDLFEFEKFLQGKMSFEEMIAATEGMLLQRRVGPEDVSSGFQKILRRLQEFGAAIDACVDEVDEDSDVIFIDMHGGDASFKEV